jgi:cytoskeletal protein RodZ
MPALSPTQWIALSIILALLAALAVYFLVYWDKVSQPACRTADIKTINRQTRALQHQVPAATRKQRTLANSPASYDSDRTPDRQVADLQAFRENISQIEVTAAQNALIAMVRGVRRPTPPLHGKPCLRALPGRLLQGLGGA